MLQEKIQLPPGGGAEDYLQPVQKQGNTWGAPPLPAKPWTIPPDAAVPASKPPSPPRAKMVRECVTVHSRLLKSRSTRAFILLASRGMKMVQKCAIYEFKVLTIRECAPVSEVCTA